MATLTKRYIDSARYRSEAGRPNRRDVRWDDKVTGFGLRLYPSGRKSFVVQYRTRSGRSRLMTLGKYGVLTLEQARERAKKELVKVLDGRDPVSERRAASKVSTFRDFADLYLTDHAKPHRKSWKRDKERLDAYVLPAIGHLALKDVKPSDVAALHARVGASHPVLANRIVQLIRLMMNKAVAWGHLPEGHSNPAEMDRSGDRGVKAFRERSRERFVTPAEMPKLLEAIDAEDNIFVRAALRLYLLAGLRKNELLRSKWSDIDLDEGVWRVVRKGGQVDRIPVSTAAAAILGALPRFDDNPHVFPGNRKGAHLVNIDKNWRAVRERAGVPDVTIHDLRRSVGSWMATAGVSLHIIGQVLGHAPGDVQATAVYARLSKDASRQALEEHGERLMAVGNGKKKPDPVKERLSKLLADGNADPAELAATLRAMAEQVEGTDAAAEVD